jgi:hypothetical protein
MTTLTVHLPRPHPKQAAFVNSPHKRIIVRAGRRGGKTLGVSILAVKAFLAGQRVLYGAPTTEQVERFWTTVCKALAEPIKAGVFRKNETEHIIELPSTEQRIRAKTCWNADTLRGDYAGKLILDEWQLMDEDTWDTVGTPMLLDNNGDAVFIYTPPSLHSRSISKARDPQHAAKMFKRAREDTTGRWQAYHFTSQDNPYISREALQDITGDMTALAYRMEILAEDVDEAPGALWTRAIIESGRVIQSPDLGRVVVGVDPSATSTGDEAGIVVAGRQGHNLYILADNTLQGSPLAWATAAVTAYHMHKADCIVAEANQGGEMVAQVIRQVDTRIPVKLVHASRGKQTRAEPIAAIYEKGHAHHVGAFAALEDECCLDGDTLITTARGLIPIRDVRGLGTSLGYSEGYAIFATDVVLTRGGWRPVLASATTGFAQQMVRVQTTNGRYLLTTVRHPVYTRDRGFVRADTLHPGDTLETDEWHTSRLTTTNTANQSSSMTRAGLSTIVATTWTARVDSCIAWCGKQLTDLSQRAMSFITRMAIGSTTMLPTWSSCPAESMTTITHVTDGPNQNGNVNPNNSKNDGQIRNRTRSNASVAEPNSKPLECVPCSVPRSAAVDTISSIEVIDRPTTVYNLTVNNVHEFYANGVLVHNCLWLPGDPSPNRMDALVWAASDLMLSPDYKKPEAVRYA